MNTIKLKSKGSDVFLLEQLLAELGYNVIVTDYFGKDTHAAVVDFQANNDLVSDGICGPKTWSMLINKVPKVLTGLEKMLSENDLIQFAQKYKIELAAIKAVNEVESNGRGFLVEGRPKILFEGHVFWKELQNRGLDPKTLVSPASSNVLFKNSTKVHYVGGKGEYDRLEKAAELGSSPLIKDAALCSASWGSYQVMGYHFKSLGYANITEFIQKMNAHEREHLDAFGRYLEVNNIIRHLKNHDWTAFARAYNGAGFAKFSYDIKIEKAYRKYSL
ncbi:MAG: N-acetylmuramidase domain-containing protein [Leadbetterella sp.]